MLLGFLVGEGGRLGKEGESHGRRERRHRTPTRGTGAQTTTFVITVGWGPEGGPSGMRAVERIRCPPRFEGPSRGPTGE